MVSGDDEEAKRFDLFVLRTQLAILQAAAAKVDHMVQELDEIRQRAAA